MLHLGLSSTVKLKFLANIRTSGESCWLTNQESCIIIDRYVDSVLLESMASGRLKMCKYAYRIRAFRLDNRKVRVV
ncbi:MAG TPA: hypothetical protein H9717_07820 [Candidatus Eisenbergiella merdipullorum]|uniref:Uncharacterized protein n=1 Tax=Candidatus Eisenbergiella merdipullorum TaxID=2838553 RepID=A0A9D2I6Z9_9FIRM|nr:hypothetical protein [Candidatus Eisenbergiella merdipullorum]